MVIDLNQAGIKLQLFQFVITFAMNKFPLKIMHFGIKVEKSYSTCMSCHKFQKAFLKVFC